MAAGNPDRRRRWSRVRPSQRWLWRLSRSTPRRPGLRTGEPGSWRTSEAVAVGASGAAAPLTGAAFGSQRARCGRARRPPDSVSTEARRRVDPYAGFGRRARERAAPRRHGAREMPAPASVGDGAARDLQPEATLGSGPTRQPWLVGPKGAASRSPRKPADRRPGSGCRAWDDLGSTPPSGPATVCRLDRLPSGSWSALDAGDPLDVRWWQPRLSRAELRNCSGQAWNGRKHKRGGDGKPCPLQGW